MSNNTKKSIEAELVPLSAYAMKDTNTTKITHIRSSAGPSIALIKYWGKEAQGTNIPSCTSIAITLDTLQSTADIEANSESDESVLYVNKERISLDYLQPVIQALKKESASNHPQKKGRSFVLRAYNNFPTGAGLASSASGIAACTVALARYYNMVYDNTALSCLARLGSGSACRSIFGGFTRWEQGSEHATQIAPSCYWASLRMVVLIVSDKKKHISSRQAMLQCAKQSPYYPSWVEYNNSLAEEAITAIQARDIDHLGALMRQSYSAMHATMLAMKPPLLYWQPASIKAIQLAEVFRMNNISVWETMDAGPQVKYLCEEQQLPVVLSEIKATFPQYTYIVCKIGNGVQVDEM